jgi:hypothetical protein
MFTRKFKIYKTYINTLVKLVKLILSLEILCILTELIAGRYVAILSLEIIVSKVIS